MTVVAPFFSANNLARLRVLVVGFAELIEATKDEQTILDRGTALLSDLVAHDDWLPAEYAQPDPARYQQYLLHCDGRERFSVVSFVWAPGQATPVHDHRVWGLVGVLRGSELNEAFARDDAGNLVSAGPPQRLTAGSVAALSPRIGDVHRVANAERDRARSASTSTAATSARSSEPLRRARHAHAFRVWIRQQKHPQSVGQVVLVMSQAVSVREVRTILQLRQELALIDLREEASLRAGSSVVRGSIAAGSRRAGGESSYPAARHAGGAVR